MSEYLPILTAFLNSANADNIKDLILSPLFSKAINDEDIVNRVRMNPQLLENQDFLREFKKHIRSLIEDDKNRKISSLVNSFAAHSRKTYEMNVTSFKPVSETKLEKKLEDVQYSALYPLQFQKERFKISVYHNKKERDYMVRAFPLSSVEFENKDGQIETVSYSFIIFIDGLEEYETSFSKENFGFAALSGLRMEYVDPSTLEVAVHKDPDDQVEKKCYVVHTMKSFNEIMRVYNNYMKSKKIDHVFGLIYHDSRGVILVPESFKFAIQHPLHPKKCSISIDAGNLQERQVRALFNKYNLKRSGKFYQVVSADDNDAVNLLYSDMIDFLLGNEEVSMMASTLTSRTFKYRDVKIKLNTPSEPIYANESESFKTHVSDLIGRFPEQYANSNPIAYIFLGTRAYPYGGFFYENLSLTDVNPNTKSYTNVPMACQYSYLMFKEIVPYSKILISTANNETALNCYIAEYPEGTDTDLSQDSPSPVEFHIVDSQKSVFLMRVEDGKPIFKNSNVTVTIFEDFQNNVEQRMESPVLNVYIVRPINDGKLIISPGNTTRFQIESMNLSERALDLAKLFKVDQITEYRQFIDLIIERIENLGEKDREEFSQIFDSKSQGWTRDFLSHFLNSVSKDIRSHRISNINNEFLTSFERKKDSFLENTLNNVLKGSILSIAEQEIVLELERYNKPVNQTNVESSLVYSSIKEQFDSLRNLKDLPITVELIIAQSRVVDSAVSSVFISQIFDFLNREINEEDVRTELQRNGISDFKIINNGQVFVLSEKEIQIETENFTIGRFTGEQNIKRNVEGNELVHAFFRLGLDSQYSVSELVKIINKNAAYENFLTGQKFEILPGDIEIDFTSTDLGLTYYRFHCPYNKDGNFLVVKKLMDSDSHYVFELMTKAAYIVFNPNDMDFLKNAIEDMSRTSFLYSLIAGIDCPSLDMFGDTRTIFMNVLHLNQDFLYENIKIIPTSMYSIFSFSGTKEILDLNKDKVANFLEDPRLINELTNIDITPFDVVNSLRFLETDPEGKEYLAISNVKKENGAISVEKLGLISGIRNIDLGTFTNYSSEKNFRSSSEYNEKSETFIYSLFEQQVELNAALQQKKHDESLNSVRNALSMVNSQKLFENVPEVSGKVFWTKFSKNKRFYAVGLQNYVLIYVFVSGKFFQVSALFHDDVIDITFGNNLYCVTFSETQSKVWVLYTGTQMDVFIPPPEFSINDEVSGRLGQKIGTFKITNIRYFDGQTEAPKNIEKDIAFYSKYQPVYYNQNVKIESITSLHNFNTFFFSESDRYMVFDGGSCLKMMDMAKMKLVNFESINGLDKRSMNIPISTSGQWNGDSTFYGTSLTGSRIIIEVENLSVSLVDYPTSEKTVYPVTLVNGSVKFSERSEFIDIIKSVGHEDFFWIYDMFVMVKSDVASLTFLMVLSKKVLKFSMSLSKDDSSEISNFVIKSSENFIGYNVSNPVTVFMKYLSPILNGSSIIDVTFEDDYLEEIEEPEDVKFPFIRMNDTTLFIQGDSDIVVSHNYFTYEDDYTVIDVKGKYRTVNLFVSGNVSPVYDTFTGKFYVVSIDNGTLRFVEVEALEDTLNIEGKMDKPTLVTTRQYSRQNKVELLVYNKIKQEKYVMLKDGEENSLKGSVDNYPISKFLSMNRFENYSYAEIANKGITWGNLNINVDGNKLIISPKYIQVNKDREVFLYWVFQKYGQLSKDEIKEVLKRISKLKREMQETFPFIVCNVRKNVTNKYSSYEDIAREYPQVLSDDILMDLIKAIFKGFNIYDYIMELYSKAEILATQKFSLVEATISQIKNEIEEEKKKLSQVEATIANRKKEAKKDPKKGKKDPKKDSKKSKGKNQEKEEKEEIDPVLSAEIEVLQQEENSINDKISELEERIQSLENADIDTEKDREFEKIDVAISKMASIFEDIPFPTSTQFKAFKLLDATNDFSRIRDPYALELLRPREFFRFEDSYKIPDGLFKTYTNYKTIMSEVEKLQTCLKTFLREETNYEKYSNVTLESLREQMDGMKHKYFTLTDEFFSLFGKPAKVVALNAKKELLVNSSLDRAVDEANHFKNLVTKLLLGNSKKAYGTENKISRKYEKQISELAKQRKLFLSGKILNETATIRQVDLKIQKLKTNIAKKLAYILGEVPEQYKVESLIKGTTFKVQFYQYSNKKDFENEIIDLYKKVFEGEIPDNRNHMTKIMELIRRAEAIPDINERRFLLEQLEFLVDDTSNYEREMNELIEEREIVAENAKTLSLFEEKASFDEVVIQICKMDGVSIENKLKQLDLVARFNGTKTNKVEVIKPRSYVGMSIQVESKKQNATIKSKKAKEEAKSTNVRIPSQKGFEINEYMNINETQLYEFNEMGDSTYNVHYQRYAVLKSRIYCSDFIDFLLENIPLMSEQGNIKFERLKIKVSEAMLATSRSKSFYTGEDVQMTQFDIFLMMNAFYSVYSLITYMSESGKTSAVTSEMFAEILEMALEITDETFCEPLDELIEKNLETLKEITKKLPKDIRRKLDNLKELLTGKLISFKEIEARVAKNVTEKLLRISAMKNEAIFDEELQIYNFDEEEMLEIIEKKDLAINEAEIAKLSNLEVFDEYRLLLEIKRELMEQNEIEGNPHLKALDSVIDAALNYVTVDDDYETYDKLNWYRYNGLEENAKGKEKYAEYHVPSIKANMKTLQKRIKNKEYVMNTESRLGLTAEKFLTNIMKQYQNTGTDIVDNSIINQIIIEFPTEIELESEKSESEFQMLKINLKIPRDLKNVNQLSKVTLDLKETLKNVWDQSRMSRIYDKLQNKEEYEGAEFMKISKEHYEKAGKYGYSKENFKDVFEKVILTKVYTENQDVVTTQYNAIDFGDQIFKSLSMSYVDDYDEKILKFYKKVADFDYEGLVQKSSIKIFENPITIGSATFCIKTGNVEDPTTKGKTVTMVCIQNVEDGKRKVYVGKKAHETKETTLTKGMKETTVTKETKSYELKTPGEVLKFLNENKVAYLEPTSGKIEIKSQKVVKRQEKIFTISTYKKNEANGTFIIFDNVNLDFKNLIVKDISLLDSKLWIVGLNYNSGEYIVRCGTIDIQNITKSYTINNFDDEYEIDVRLTKDKLIKFTDGNLKAIAISGKRGDKNVNVVVTLRNRNRKLELKLEKDERIVDITSAEFGNFLTVICKEKTFLVNYAGEIVKEIEGEAFLM